MMKTKDNGDNLSWVKKVLENYDYIEIIKFLIDNYETKYKSNTEFITKKNATIYNL